MKPFFRELFEYNSHFNQRIISVLIENQEKSLEKSIRLVSHILNVHQTWNLKIEPGQVSHSAWDIHPLQNLAETDRENFVQSILILDKYDMGDSIQYTTSSGQVFTNTVQDILFQVINHSTYHRGQIASEFRQTALEPLLTDYIFYKMK